MVAAVVAELEFVRLAAQRQADKLMAKVREKLGRSKPPENKLEPDKKQ